MVGKRTFVIPALVLAISLVTACGAASSDNSGSAYTDMTDHSKSVSTGAGETTESASTDIIENSDSPSIDIDNSSGRAATEVSQESTNRITFEDDLGRSVTVQEKPERVAVLIGSFADIWCLAGGKDSIVAAADDTWTGFDLGLPDTVVSTGGVKTPDAEKVLAADPDFIIASSSTSEDVDLKDIFEQAGVPTAYFDVDGFDDYLHMLEICTEITGNPQNYETYGTQVEDQVNNARQRAQQALSGGAPAPTCLYVRATASSVKVKGSSGNVLGEMLRDLGAVNIADSDSGLLENLSLESILTDNPDFIFVVIQASTAQKQEEAEQALTDTLTSDPAWGSLSAVLNGHYYTMDNSLYNLKPNARWGEAYQNLENILYGDSSI